MCVRRGIDLVISADVLGRCWPVFSPRCCHVRWPTWFRPLLTRVFIRLFSLSMSYPDVFSCKGARGRGWEVCICMERVCGVVGT